MNAQTRCIAVVLTMLSLLALPIGATAQVAAENESELSVLSFVDESLTARPVVEAMDDIKGSLRSSVASGWAELLTLDDGEWTASVDKRTGSIDFVEGSGIPWIPGYGNSLVVEVDTSKPDLATLESISRSFLPRVAPMLGVDIESLKLDAGRSGSPIDYLWYVDYNVEYDGLPVDGARVVFRVNHGNLIQFGSENLPSPGVEAPVAKLTRNQALSALAGYIGGFRAADSFVDSGSQHLLPTAIADSRFNDGFELGNGRGLTRVWQFVFRRDGDFATWRARVDAVNGRLLELRDINDYATAQVTGGVKFLGVPATHPMPFADVSSGGFTNSAGVYNYTSGTITSVLNGQYVKIFDNCGAISQSSGAGGNISFGTSAGTDCTTPGSGGAGNTHSARTQFYHVNRAKEIARGWLSGNAWLNAQLTAKVNLNDINYICNAFWDSLTINFFLSGGGCGNTGEIEGLSLHEYGHGLDTNDGGGTSPDFGTGETYGDFTSALTTHTSCVGAGVLASNCSGYSDACTSCTGYRDIDWAKHVLNTPSTVGNFTVHCRAGGGYNGPCAQEGHCESLVPSQALWDLAARDLPSPGTGSAWATVDRLWYLSRITATGAFTCVKTTSPWTSNGCGAGSLWKTMRAVDDDDGNLTNGTPNSAALYAAFNRHGIACTTDVGANTSFRGCTPPAVPSLSLTAGDNQVTVNVSGSTGVYDVYRTENGCNSGFIKDTNDSASTSVIDTDVANGFTYYYQVTAQPSGNEACASAPSTCLSVTPIPCTPPTAPTGLTATAASQTQVNLSWTAAAGATEYHVYRATTSGGPYTLAGTTAGTTFADTGLTINTVYYYVVRAANSGACESGNSNQAAATTNAWTLNVSKTGTGTGTVDSAPAGITCGGDCSESYLEGTVVTLTATPLAGSTFTGWSGDCTGTGSCAVTMAAARSVTATFSITTQTLTVSLVGAGTVTSSPAGINCGTTCSASYNHGTVVTLTATPSAGSVFGGWSGACSGTGGCTVTMDQARSVMATFSVATYTLTATLAGSGTVTSSPAGINCGTDCTETYNQGTVVTLTATPSVGSVFGGWSGACSGTGGCTVTMDQARSVTATFSVATYTLTASLTGAGSGTVTSSPAGINCGVDCSEVYNHGTLVTLTASPSVGSVFGGWSGACSGTGGCTVTMNQARSVTATFALATNTLTVSRAGSGSGTVTSSPAGINCGPDCSEVYNYGTLVTLAATPSSGSLFGGWSGACTGTGGCTVTMDQARSVTATFTSSTYRLTVSRAGTGNGIVTSSPLGINCGTTCSAIYESGTVVTLMATSAPGSTFDGWGGACSGIVSTCMVTMVQAQTVTATFSVATYTLTVSRAGIGSGTVTSSPAGINCGTDCSEVYSHGVLVTLTATPSAGSVFGGWSGACSGTGGCTVTMNQVRSVTATFGGTDLDFYTVVPCRVIDTRLTGVPLTSGVATIFPVTGTCGVPSTAKAVSVNVAAISASGEGDIVLYRGDVLTAPPTSTISFPALLNRSNNAIVSLGGNGTMAGLAVLSNSGTMDMAVDVNGYFE